MCEENKELENDEVSETKTSKVKSILSGAVNTINKSADTFNSAAKSGISTAGNVAKSGISAASNVAISGVSKGAKVIGNIYDSIHDKKARKEAELDDAKNEAEEARLEAERLKKLLETTNKLNEIETAINAFKTNLFNKGKKADALKLFEGFKSFILESTEGFNFNAFFDLLKTVAPNCMNLASELYQERLNA